MPKYESRRKMELHMKTLQKKMEDGWLILLMWTDRVGILLPNQRHIKTQNSKNLASAIQNKCLAIDF